MVQSNQKIDVHLNAEIKTVDGFVGNFKTTVQMDGKEEL